MGYETLWITQNIRTTAPPRGGASPARLAFARGGPPGARLGKLGIAVAECLAAGRRRRLGPQAGARPASQVDRRAMPPGTQPIVARCQSQRFSQRAVDLDSHRGGDSGALWGALSPCARLEDPTPLELELSGPRASTHPTRRAGHHPLEALHVAGDKKKPSAWELTSPSWMRAVFGSCPLAAAPGRLPDTRRSFHPT